MRWTALVAKTVVAGAAGAFLAVSAAGAPPPRQAPGPEGTVEVPAGQHRATERPSSSPTGR
ncbi:hypothetical protein ACFXDJ_31815 [Streptomyces sp. NPDC059443]|uniref:hypothetical protein n=1 Tax=unclassified Streptomyces TaxID=2593676 RepID=UPI00369F22B4